MKYSELFYGRHFRGIHYMRRASLNLCCSILIFVYFEIYIIICSLQFPFPATVVFIGTMLFAFQQLSGINAVFYFSSAVFRSAGVPSDIANICVGFAYLSGQTRETQWSYHVLLTSGLSFFSNRLSCRHAFDGHIRKEASSCRKFSGNGKVAILVSKIFVDCEFICISQLQLVLIQAAAMGLQAIAASLSDQGSWHVNLSVGGMLL